MEITTLADIQHLVVIPGTDWKQYGEVHVQYSGDLAIFNYSPAAQFANRWNVFERVSRGLILNTRTGEVVALPFSKFFNWGQEPISHRGGIVSVTEKLDGSLGLLYRDNGEHKIATRGSFTSDQALWATNWLQSNHGGIRGLCQEWTLLFEILYPENRVVVDYHGRKALVLLAVRNRFTGIYLSTSVVDHLASAYTFERPQSFSFGTVEEIIEACQSIDVNQEGWVAEFVDGSRVKFKGDQYVALHRLLMHLSFKHALEAVQGGTLPQLRERIPDEFAGEFTGWVAEIEETIQGTHGAVASAMARAPAGADRKTFALWVQSEHPEIASYLFATLDGRDITPMIYRQAFKDRREESPRVSTEETA